VIDVIRELEEFGTEVSVYDPWADPKEVKHEYGIEILHSLETLMYDAVVLAVAHDKFAELDIDNLSNGNATVIYDIKSKLNKSDGKL
jgi:UDP-N-acetyl-D-galactosamine dehydrogenase